MRLKRRRKAVTLLITLSVIAVMIGLLGILYGYLDEARKKANDQSVLIQGTLVRSDLQKLLAKYLSDKPSLKTLQTIQNTPLPIYDVSGNFGITLQCNLLNDRIPLAWLRAPDKSPDAKKRHNLAMDLAEKLTERAQLRDPERLIEMIQEALSGKRRRMGNLTWLQDKAGAIEKSTFEALLREYRFESDDPNVDRIDWQRYFLLRPLPSSLEKLNKQFLTPELVSTLYDQDLQSVKENYTPGALDEFLSSIGEDERYTWLYAKSPIAALHCEGNLNFREAGYNIAFDYLQKRIEHFEIRR